MKHYIDITIATLTIIAVISGTAMYTYVLLNMRRLAMRGKEHWMQSLGSIWLVSFANRDENLAHKGVVIGSFVTLAFVALFIWLDMPYSAFSFLAQVGMTFVATIPALDISKRVRRDYPELIFG